MPRTARVKKSSEGTYHVMVRGNEKKEIFRDDEDRIRFLDIVNHNQDRYGFFIYAYCLMSNHVHILLGCNGCDISQIMKSINISYVSFFNRKYQRSGHLFQDRFKSELVDTDAYAIEVSRYIHLNPVRVGMIHVGEIAQYLWSSYAQYSSSEARGHLPVAERFILEMFSDQLSVARLEYQRYVMRDDSDMRVETDEAIPIENLLMATSAGNENNDSQRIVEKVAADYGVGWIHIENGSIPIGIRNEMILKVRQNSQLTLKVIGEMFGGLSESMVSKIIKGK